MPESFNQYLDSGTLAPLALEWGLALISALALFVIGRWLAKGIAGALRRSVLKANGDWPLASFLSNFAAGVMLIVFRPFKAGDFVEADERVLAEPAPAILCMNLGDSSVDIAVRPRVKTPDYWALRADLIKQIKTGLDAAGLSIPFPQRDVHLHSANDNARAA